MLNLDITPINMSQDELSNWLNECAGEIESAYEQDNINYANKLDMIYQAVKQIQLDKQNESLHNYIKNNVLVESVIEDGNSEIELIEVDENIKSLEKNLKDCKIEVSAGAEVNDDLEITGFDPIIVDIEFKLEYLEEPQHIILTYTTPEIPKDLNIDSLPKKDYKATSTDDGMQITFKSISNLADELDGVMFKELIEWPFEMSFKSAAVEKKFEKNASLTSKIIALLGKEQLINKVSGYQSTHSSGSNRETRAKREAEELRTSIRSRGPIRTRSQILYDSLAAIPGVTSVTEFDVPGSGRYYKRLRVIFRGGVIDVFNGGLDFMVSDRAGGFGNKQEFFTDTEDKTASLNDTRNKMLTYVKKRMAIMQRGPEVMQKSRTSVQRRPQFDINVVYREFVDTAEGIIAGTAEVPISSLERKYDMLLDSEQYLSDEQMKKISELAKKLNM